LRQFSVCILYLIGNWAAIRHPTEPRTSSVNKAGEPTDRWFQFVEKRANLSPDLDASFIGGRKQRT
jgi:hypothetical protein